MEPTSLLASLKAEGLRFADIAEEADVTRTVPCCSGWTIEKLVGHLGNAHRWSEEVVRTGDRVDFKNLGIPPSGRDLIPWFREGHDRLVDTLTAVDPDRPTWVFLKGASPTARWWFRRQAIETIVHRVDLQQAAGIDPTAADGAVAAAGIDEMLGETLPSLRARDRAPGLSGTLHLHASEAGGEPGEWWVDFDAAEWVPDHRHTKADTAVRGTASALLLWLWSRLTPAEARLEVFGPAGIVDALTQISI